VTTVNSRRLHILLVLWCGLLLAPRVLAEFGAFGSISVDKNISGAMAFSWIAGYLAQFAVFMWIMNVVQEQKILWWFIASLLPWAADWAPHTPLYTLLCLVLTVASAVWIAQANRREDLLQHQGILAQGTVLEVLKPWMNVVINNVYIKRKLRLRIAREDGVPEYEGILNGLFMLGEIPSPGDKIPLVIDPTTPQRFEYRKDDEDASSKSAAPAHAGSTSTHPSSSPSSHGKAPAVLNRSNIVDELARLASLRDRGALTEVEYAAAKKKLLLD
jgi:hypothetical protein